MTCGTSAGQLLYINYSPRYTHLKRGNFVLPYHEQIRARSKRERGKRDSTAAPVMRNEDEQHILRSAWSGQKSWGHRILHHDNAWPHMTHLVEGWFEHHHIDIIEHPPYSLDVAPTTFGCFQPSNVDSRDNPSSQMWMWCTKCSKSSFAFSQKNLPKQSRKNRSSVLQQMYSILTRTIRKEQLVSLRMSVLYPIPNKCHFNMFYVFALAYTTTVFLMIYPTIFLLFCRTQACTVTRVCTVSLRMHSVSTFAFTF